MEPPGRFRDLPIWRGFGLEVPVAASLRARTFGLIGLDRDQAGPGLLLPRCRSIHTFGMRFEIDLVFLDRSGECLKVRRAEPPHRVVGCRGAAAVLEIVPGTGVGGREIGPGGYREHAP